MDKNKFWLGGRLFNTASPRLDALTQRKAHPKDGRPNATQGKSSSWAPQRNARHVCKLGAPMHVRNANASYARTSATQMQGMPARPQLGRPNVMQGTSRSWAPKRNARRVRKMGAQTQRKASSQDGRPNEKLIHNENIHTREHLAKSRPGGWIRTNFGLEVDILIRPHPGWAPQRNERCVRKMGAQTQRQTCSQDERPNEKPIRNENVGCPNATEGTSGSWVPERTYATQTEGTSAHPKIGRHNALQGTSASWVPKRNARRVRKMGAQTKNSSATKTSTQGSTRLKDELEDG
jgi:hypothetical protein